MSSSGSNSDQFSDEDSLTSCSILDTDTDSEDEACPTEVVWAKSARGVWGLGHVFGNKLYFTRDIPEENWVPETLVDPVEPAPKPTPKPRPKPGPNPAPKSAPKPGTKHVQSVQNGLVPQPGVPQRRSHSPNCA